MKTNAALSLLIAVVAACSHTSAPEPAVSIATKTIYVQFTGDQKLADRILYQLTLEQPCIAMLNGCHAFIEYPGNPSLRDPENPVYKITLVPPQANSGGRFSLQGFKAEGKKLIRNFNPGEFDVPSEHQKANGDNDFSEDRYVKDVATGIIELSFK